MQHRIFNLPSVLLVSLVTSTWGTLLHLPDGGVTQVETLVGVPKWHLYPHLWSYTNVDVSCPDDLVGLPRWDVTYSADTLAD